MSVLASNDAVILQVENAWNEWISAIAGLDDAAMRAVGPCGDWTVTDLAFHLAFWDEQAGFDLQFRHDNNGEAPPPRDWQAMNDEDYARHVGRSPEDGLKVMQATHESLMRLNEAHREDDLAWIVPDLVDHYNEHTAQVTEWRAVQGS